VHSTPGGGSEFELVLPVTAPGADLAETRPAAPGADGTVPASAPSPPGQPGEGEAVLEDQWRGRTR